MNDKLNLSEETLAKLSIEEIVDLKIKVDEISNKLDEILETCKEILNS